MEQQIKPVGIIPQLTAASARRANHAAPAVLTVIEKEQVLQRITLDQKRALTFGRIKENDVVLQDQAISRRHFKLERHNDDWTVVDLNSTNGVQVGTERLDPFVRTGWDGSQPIKVGPYLITLGDQFNDTPVRRNELNGQRDSAYARPNGVPLPNGAADVFDYTDQPLPPLASDTLQLTLQPTSAQIEPGATAALSLKIHNLSNRLQQFNVLVSGIPQDWVTIASPRIVVAANSTQTVGVTIQPTTETAGLESGEHPFAVYVYSQNNQDQAAIVKGRIIVAPVHRFQLDVDESRHQNGVACTISVTNQGNIGDVYNIRAHDEQDALNFRARHWQILLTPGTDANRRVLIKPKHQPLFGSAKEVPFSISVKSDSGLKEVYESSVTVRPRVSLPFVLALIAIVLLGVLAVWVATAYANGGTSPLTTILQLLTNLTSWIGNLLG